MHELYNSNTARFDGTARALTEDEMRKIAPSIFAVAAHDSRSERFAPIPTIEVLGGLAREGFYPVACRQSGSRDPGKRDFTKHMIRLRRLDDAPEKYSVGDTVYEIVLKNANDGSSAYDLMAGLFRIRCLNSLVAQTSTLDAVKVRHSGDVTNKVIEGTYKVLAESDVALGAVDAWSQLRMTDQSRAVLAEAAHVLRFGDAEGNVDTAIQPNQLLRTRRAQDNTANLWDAFNVVQENVIRGGLRGLRRDGVHRPRRVTTREVKGIDQDVRLNKALFIVANHMAELLKAA